MRSAGRAAAWKRIRPEPPSAATASATARGFCRRKQEEPIPNAISTRSAGTLRLDAPVELAKRYLPLFDLNLGWLLPAVAGFVIGMAIHLSRRGRAK